MIKRLALLLAAATFAATASVGSAPIARAGAACEYPAAADINGDGRPEMLVGVPNASGGAGAVDVFYDVAKAPVRVTAARLGFPASSRGDHFGQSVLVRDLNADGCSDLIVGAPGASSGRGRLYVAYGSPDGLRKSGGRKVTGPDRGASFGYALSSFYTADGRALLAVGAPGYDAGSATDAGAVYLIGMDLVTGTWESPVRITQGKGGIADASEARDRFGEVLSGALVGVPHEDVGNRANAGCVIRLRVLSLHPLSLKGALWTQDSPGVPGVAEAGDEFGASVSDSFYATVGVPGEDIGTVRDAGMVQVFKQTDAWQADGFVPYRAYDQGTLGIPGMNEAGDRFGAAVAVGNLESGESGYNLWVGHPGEDLGTLRDAGAVTRIQLGGSFLPTVGLTSGNGLPGTAEAGDRLGAAFGRVEDYDNEEENGSTSLLIGVPGENRGKVADSGWVIFGKHSRTVEPSYAGLVNRAIAGERYGQVFGG